MPAPCRYCSARANSIPTSIAGTNTSVPVASSGSDTMAGPGQKPDSPQPTPNRAAPMTSGASMAVFVGSENASAKSGLPRPNASR